MLSLSPYPAAVQDADSYQQKKRSTPFEVPLSLGVGVGYSP